MLMDRNGTCVCIYRGNRQSEAYMKLISGEFRDTQVGISTHCSIVEPRAQCQRDRQSGGQGDVASTLPVQGQVGQVSK
jgi:hypothetical protein